MKNNFFLFIALFGALNAPTAQNVNWRGLEPNQKHLVNLNAGFDYGLTVGVGYGYKLPSRIPIVVNLEYASPAGRNLFDDFKTKFGAQAEIAHLGDFSATVRLSGNFRRYENDLVRIVGFGSELSGTFGYFRRRWFFAGELGFDKAIVTHFKHSQLAREDFPFVQDGWYLPTAGNLSYGIQTGLSFHKIDLYLKMGKVISQDFRTTPTVPFYVQLGCNRKF